MGIQQQLGSTAPKPNAVQRIVHKVAGSRVGGAALSKIAPPLDKLISRASGGRGTSTQLLTGLPIMMLTTTGPRPVRSGPVRYLVFPYGEDFGLQSGNFGVTSVPAWVHNLRANAQATIEYGGTSIDVIHASENLDEILGAGAALFPGLELRTSPIDGTCSC